MEDLLDAPVSDPEVVAPGRKRLGRRAKRLVGAAVLVPVAAIAATYALFFTPDAPGELRLSAKAGDAGQAVRAGVWSVGQGSVAGYRVREKLLRLPAPNDAVGRTSTITAAFHLQSERSGIRVQPGMRIDVDVASITSDESRRDDHMRTMAIETDKFPTATFVTTSEVVLPAQVASGGQASFTVDGDLTLHGVTRPVSIPVQAQHTGGRIEVVGALAFGWDQFEMKQPNLNYVTVESDPTVEFRLFFDHQSPDPAP